MSVEIDLTRFAKHLLDARDEVLDRWEALAKADPRLSTAETLSHAEFKDGIPLAIERMVGVLQGDYSHIKDAVSEDVAKHGWHRWQHGYGLPELLREWFLLRQVFQDEVEAFDFDIERSRVQAGKLLSAFTEEAVFRSACRYDDLRKMEASARVRDLEAFRADFEPLNRERGVLLRETAHDLRGQLSVMVGLTEALESKSIPVDDSTSKAVLQAVKEGVEQMLSMINSLLQLARLEAGQERLEIGAMDAAAEIRKLGESMQHLAQAKGLTLQVETPDSLPVQSDLVKVHRIIMNLLTNAITHTEEGIIQLSCTSEGNRWMVLVKDSGPGLPQSLQTLLEGKISGNGTPRPETSMKSKTGEGIGLTIVRRLSDLLAATINATSAPGKGTTFVVSFPR